MSDRWTPPPARGQGGGARPPVGGPSTAMIIAGAGLVIVAGIIGYLAFQMHGSPKPVIGRLAVASPTASPRSSRATAASASVNPTSSPIAVADGTSTATGTEEATATADETATATGTAQAAGTAAATGTASARSTATAASTKAASSTSTSTSSGSSDSGSKPAVGDFGELPAADIPSGNSAGRAMNVDYRLDMSLQAVPQSATVYQLQPRQWTKDEVAQLAKSIGVTGQVVDQGGSFRATGSGDLYIAGNLVQYIAPSNSATPVGGALPSNDSAVQAARSWLLQHNLVGANVGPGSVVGRDDSAKQVQVQVKPADPQNILSATPSATVTVGPGGAILEVSSRWPAAFQRSSYGLQSADDLWTTAKNGQGYLEVNPDALPGGTLNGTVTVTGASLAYTIAGSPDSTQYLVPLVVFNGQATYGSGGAVPVKIYVPSVGAQAAPRG